MINNKAFTLLEVLISLVISAFIMTSALKFYVNSQNYLIKGASYLKFDGEVYKILDLIEDDLSSIYVPNVENKKIFLEKPVNKLFILEKSSEDNLKRFPGISSKIPLLSRINFVSLNSFTVYEDNRSRLVKLVYRLEKSKIKTQSNLPVYSLYREEFPLFNDGYNKEPKKLLNKILLAENINHFAIEFYSILDKRVDDIDSNINFDLDNLYKKTFSCGIMDEKNKKMIPPSRVRLYVSFWDETFSNISYFTLDIPIIFDFTYVESKNKKQSKLKKSNIRQNKVESGPAAKKKLKIKNNEKASNGKNQNSGKLI